MPIREHVFKSPLDALRLALADNAQHGLPLTTWDIKRNIARFSAEGASLEELSGLLSMPIKKLEKLGSMTVAVVGKRGKKELKPLKRGMECMKGKTVTVEAYKAHEKHDRGVSVLALIRELQHRLEAKWLDLERAEIQDGLKELKTAIEGCLSKV